MLIERAAGKRVDPKTEGNNLKIIKLINYQNK